MNIGQHALVIKLQLSKVIYYIKQTLGVLGSCSMHVIHVYYLAKVGMVFLQKAINYQYEAYTHVNLHQQ